MGWLKVNGNIPSRSVHLRFADQKGNVLIIPLDTYTKSDMTRPKTPDGERMELAEVYIAVETSHEY